MKLNSIVVAKLGSSASQVTIQDGIVTKRHSCSPSDLIAFSEGIRILERYYPESLLSPLTVHRFPEEKDVPKHSHFEYSQAYLSPWVYPEWITGLQLYEMGCTILAQQNLLMKHGYCLVDARPSNYWLANRQSVLVDLASIKTLSAKTIRSFQADFVSHVINPLILEKDLSIPVALYFKAGLDSQHINTWKLSSSWTRMSRLRLLVETRITNFLSQKISTSSPSFIKYLLATGTSESKNPVRSPSGFTARWRKLLDSTAPFKHLKTNWSYYSDFHDCNYTQKKLNAIRSFLAKRSSIEKVVDLGSNTTTLQIPSIHVRIDNDVSITGLLRSQCGADQSVFLIDIADALCNPESRVFHGLNCNGYVTSALVLGLIHHIIIDRGLATQIFYQRMACLFTNILLEFPLSTDPMVQLLISKKDEPIDWDLEQHHLPVLSQWFNVQSKHTLSETRVVLELQKIA